MYVEMPIFFIDSEKNVQLRFLIYFDTVTEDEFGPYASVCQMPEVRVLEMGDSPRDFHL